MLCSSGCRTSPFYCTFEWSEAGAKGFVAFNVERGDADPTVVDVKRLYKQCKGSKAKYDL